MVTADNQPLYAGRTVYVLSNGNVVEHTVAALADGQVWFEQPEAEGPLSCPPYETFAWFAAAEQQLDLNACLVAA